jgi:hypothetical protein
MPQIHNQDQERRYQLLLLDSTQTKNMPQIREAPRQELLKRISTPKDNNQ